MKLPTTPSCPLCDNQQHQLVFTANNMPVFQNVVFETKQLASDSSAGDITLLLCHQCGLVFNASFNPQDLQFNARYENEQGHSSYYRHYLSSIIDLFKQKGFENKKIVEIGCGKGFFLEQLAQAGFDVAGFDPAYEGDNPGIVKDYFSRRYSTLSANVIVLRHMLAHIQRPLEFLHLIAEAVNYDASIYIETAALNWILEQGAFWDIYYENCNYFTAQTLAALFSQSEQGSLFGGQYQYVIANLKDLVKPNQVLLNKTLEAQHFSKLTARINRFRERLTQKPQIAIWGAAGKGVSFANFIDSHSELISCLIDINPKKHQHYIPKTAHKIISPNELKDDTVPAILVMNDNYLNEIKAMVAPFNIPVMTLDTI